MHSSNIIDVAKSFGIKIRLIDGNDWMYVDNLFKYLVFQFLS